MKNKKTIIKNNKGMALVEMLPLLVVFVAFVSLTIGMWGSVYSAVVQSVSARHYAFEVLNNRAHFEYHRDYTLQDSKGSGLSYGSSQNPQTFDTQNFYGEIGSRLFLIVSPGANNKPYATERYITLFANTSSSSKDFIDSSDTKKTAQWHNEKTWDQGGQSFSIEKVNPVWLMTGYGICINANCGDPAL